MLRAAHADPVEAVRNGLRAVRFHGNAKAERVQGFEQRFVELQERLAPGADDEAVFAKVRRPRGENRAREPIGGFEFAAARAVGAGEVGVAEPAERRGPVFLAPRPEVAAGKAQEHRGPAGIHAFALQGVEDFFDGVHWEESRTGVRLSKF